MLSWSWCREIKCTCRGVAGVELKSMGAVCVVAGRYAHALVIMIDPQHGNEHLCFTL